MGKGIFGRFLAKSLTTLVCEYKLGDQCFDEIHTFPGYARF